MTDLINFLTSKEIIVVYIVALVACMLYFIVHLIDKYYYKRKQRQNTKELNRLVEDINYELAKERENSVVENINNEQDDDVIYVEPVFEKITDDDSLDQYQKAEVEELNDKVEVEELNEVVDSSREVELEELEPIVEVENLKKTLEINLDKTDNIKEEAVDTLDYTEAFPNRTEAQEELRKLTEALENAEENRNIDLTSYEKMQEEEAIISMDELLKKSKEMYEANELTQYADEGNEPISLEDLEKTIKLSLEKEELEANPLNTDIGDNVEVANTTPEIINSAPPERFVMDDFYTIKERKESPTAYSEYKSTPVISPIYGIQKTPTDRDIELENTANYEKLDQEIKKTNEFLMTLKDLQKNLD